MVLIPLHRRQVITFVVPTGWQWKGCIYILTRRQSRMLIIRRSSTCLAAQKTFSLGRSLPTNRDPTVCTWFPLLCRSTVNNVVQLAKLSIVVNAVKKPRIVNVLILRTLILRCSIALVHACPLIFQSMCDVESSSFSPSSIDLDLSEHCFSSQIAPFFPSS